MIGASSAVAHGGAVEDADGRGVIGVAERRAHHEAVELRLGQAVGACLLDGVLRREHEERHADLARDAVDRDAALLHDLEQGGLRLRARAVDLVGEHDVREDRAGVELEHALLLVVHADAGDVAGQQIGRELDAGVRALHRLRHRAGERGLAGSGHVLEQHVAVAEHRRQHEFDDVALAEHRSLHVVGDLTERLREPGRLLLRDGHGCCPSSVADVGGRGSRRGHGAAGGVGQVRDRSRPRRSCGRRREAPSLRAPVDRDADALDADRADRHGPRAGRAGSDRAVLRRRTRSPALPK